MTNCDTRCHSSYWLLFLQTRGVLSLVRLGGAAIGIVSVVLVAESLSTLLTLDKGSVQGYMHRSV
jgi:hypothetical protein